MRPWLPIVLGCTLTSGAIACHRPMTPTIASSRAATPQAATPPPSDAMPKGEVSHDAGAAKDDTDRFWSWSDAEPTMHMVDERHGWAIVTTPRQLARTDDGGRTWTTMPRAGVTPYDVVAVDANTALAVSLILRAEVSEATEVRIDRTEDAGKTWTTGRIPLSPRMIPIQSATVTMDGAEGGRADVECEHGMNSLCSFRFATSDGGRSWRPLPSPGLVLLGGKGEAPTTPMPSCVRDTCTIVLKGGARVRLNWSFDEERAGNIERSSDAGRTWQPVTMPHPFGNGAWFIRRDAKLLVAELEVRGVPSVDVVASTDGGHTWHLVDTVEGARGAGGVTTNASLDRGWVVVEHDAAAIRVMHTPDEGATWAAFDARLPGKCAPSCELRGLVTVSSTEAFAVMKAREASAFVATHDGGRSWERVPVEIVGP